MGEADFVDLVDQSGSANQGITPTTHRCGPGMGFLSGQGDLVPALALGISDHTDLLLLILEDGPLFDMRFKEHLEWPAADTIGAVVSDALQLLAHGLAVE